ncbi:ELM2 domain-containing protein [Entamoeba marina]
MQKHQTRVGPEFQAVIPSDKYFIGSRPTLSRCVQKAKCDGMTRADTAETCGILMFCCDKIPESVLEEYMKKAEALTPPFVKFDRTEALQMLHNNNYIVDDALLQLRMNVMNQNNYNEIQFTEKHTFPYFD